MLEQLTYILAKRLNLVKMKEVDIMILQSVILSTITLANLMRLSVFIRLFLSGFNRFLFGQSE